MLSYILRRILSTLPVMGIVALFVFGYFKSKVTGQPAVAGALRTTMVGVIAAGCAYGIATLIT